MVKCHNMIELCVICSRPHDGYWVGLCGPFCEACWEKRLIKDSGIGEVSLESRVEELEARIHKVEGQLFQQNPMPKLGLR